jgi:hypothetical protein
MKQWSVCDKGVNLRYAKFDSPGDTLSGEFNYYYLLYPRLYWMIGNVRLSDNKKLNALLGEVKPGANISLSYDGKNYRVEV